MKINKILFGLSLMVGMTLSACDDLLDVNTDPDNPSTSTPQLTLPVGEVAIASLLDANYNILGNLLAQYWTTGPTAPQYSYIDQYNIRTTDFDGAWTFAYSSALSDLDFVRTYSIENDLPNYAAVAQLLQCYTYQILVDLYDQVPYSEALQGKQGNVAARFDTGEAIYNDLIVKIDEALAWINPSASAVQPGDDDLIYGGNMERWIKFGNTLKLKIYIRQAFRRPEVAQAGIEEMYAEGASFINPGEDARITFSTTLHNENPLWQELNQTSFENLVASSTALEMLKEVNDTRLENLYDPNAEGQYEGLEQGIGTQDGGSYDDYATPDFTRIITETSPTYLITGYESLFLQAEAALRGWSDGDPEALYNAAVLASFSFWGKDGSNYIGVGDDYEYDGTLETLYYQKWIAFNGKQGLEGWIEWRRTGVPVLPLSAQGRPLPNDFPLRLIWPQTERSANPNVPPAETVDTPVWWDTTF